MSDERCSFDLGTGDGERRDSAGTLPGAPIRPGTVEIRWRAQPPNRSMGQDRDNGAGGWISRTGVVDYRSGTIGIVWRTAPRKGAAVVVTYRREEPSEAPPPDPQAPSGPLKMQVRHWPPKRGQPEWLEYVAGQAAAEVVCPTCQTPAGTFCPPGTAQATHLSRLHAWSERPTKADDTVSGPEA